MVTIRCVQRAWFVAVLALTAALPVTADDDYETAMRYLDVIDRWSNYATYGQQYGADKVIDTLIDARQLRLYVTIIDERVRAARADVEADLAKERLWDYDRNSGGPDVVVGPDMATLRRLQQRKIRDLERTIAAFDAVLDCMDPDDDRCVEVREIERQRAEWRKTGDPLPQNSDIPDTSQMRAMLESAFRRHRLTLKRYRQDIERLQVVSNELAESHLIFEQRLNDLRAYRRTVGTITSELEARRTTCRRVCDDADLSASSVRQRAAEAAAAASECEQKMAAAGALAATCSGPAEADRIDDLVRDAETARDTVVAKVDEAKDHARTLIAQLERHRRERDVAAIRQRLLAESSAASDAGGAIIDRLVEIGRTFAETDAVHADVTTIVEDLATLGFLDDEAASWEQALSDDRATITVMKQRFAELRREYDTVHVLATKVLAAATKVLGGIGAPESLQSASEQENDRIRAAEEKARGVTIPDCTVRAIDVSTLNPDVSRVQGLLGPAAALRQAANQCRSQTPPIPAPGPSGSTAPPGGSAPSGGTQTTPVTAPNPDLFGGLVIVGLPQPARITVGQVVQLEGRDHGGRLYSGVEWVTSNERVLTADGGGRIVGRQIGEAMVLAKLGGMRAWLDVEVVDPGGTQPAATTPQGSGAGTPGGSLPGSSGGGSALPPTAGGTTGGGGSTAPTSSGDGAGAVDGLADEAFDFGDGGSGTVEVEPTEDELLGAPPTSGSTGPPGYGAMDLLGVGSAVDGGAAPPPDQPLDGGGLPTADGAVFQPFEGYGAPATAADAGRPERPDPAGTVFDAPPNRQPYAPPESPAAPTGPSQAEIVQMLQQVDCSWLDGGVAAYDGSTGQLGCTCPPDTQFATDRPACVDCIGPQNVFMNAIEARDFQLAQQAISAAQGCDWAPSAQAQLGDFICLQAEMSVLEALNQGAAAAAQNLIHAAQAQGCNISPQTASLVASAAQPPSYGTSPPPRTGPSAAEMMQMFTGVAQSLIAMQGGDPASLPGLTAPGSSAPPASSPPSTAPPSSGGGQNVEQCARQGCEAECADALGLLTEGTTERCDRCLKSARVRCASSGAASSSSSSGSGSASSSGSGAWANPQWTMPTGEGGGRCYAGKSWTRPARYAIACDGNDGSALYKLAVGGYPSMVFGPASYTDCQRFLAQLTGGQ